MPKKSDDNFLRGWCRQVQHALDEGTELGYEAAELILQLEDLITSGDTGDEVDGPDDDSGGEAGIVSRGRLEGCIEDDQPAIPGLGSPMDVLPSEHHTPGGVPRGTGSGASVLVVDGQAVEQARVCVRNGVRRGR